MQRYDTSQKCMLQNRERKWTRKRKIQYYITYFSTLQLSCKYSTPISLRHRATVCNVYFEARTRVFQIGGRGGGGEKESSSGVSSRVVRVTVQSHACMRGRGDIL